MPKQTALIEEHRRLGGRLIDFGGWELPVQYTGVMDEHLACRATCGIFDVSHMGEVHVEGKDAEAYLNYLVSNDVSKLADGQALYSEMCNDNGGVVDDLLVYKRNRERFLVVVNASNSDKDYAHMLKIQERMSTRLKNYTLSNESPNYSQIAVQGRHAEKIVQTLTKSNLSAVQTYWFTEGTVLGEIPAVLARTGYTGEDGFEVYVPWNSGPEVWRALMDAGQPHGMKPCGLGARDTLRLEMRYPLYGHELSDEGNPLEAGLGWVIKFDKGDFVGRAPMLAAKEKGLTRSLVGLKMLERGIPRQGYSILAPGTKEKVGAVTSGTQSPSLNQAIALAYVPKSMSSIGTRLAVDIRGAALAAEVIPTPFYKRPY
ncbi:glycine cleavage system aminomethyltransferase GcvT [Bdellovibrionota bacterium FG-2]